MNIETMTEMEMRDMETPWPKTIDELTSILEALTRRQHDYGTSVYAMSIAASATYNFIASSLGVTGFQSGCASLDLIKRIRSIDGPFIILEARDALYPQSLPAEKLTKFLRSQRSWLRLEARKKIKDTPKAHPDVFHEWIAAAAFAPTNKEDVEQWNALAPEDAIPTDPEGRTAWYDRNRQDHDRNCRHLAFIRNEFTEAFIEQHADECAEFGITDIYLYANGDVTKADGVKNGCSFRCGFCVDLLFQRKIGSVKVEWSVNTELDGSNGSSSLRFDWEKLADLESRATGDVKAFIGEYIQKSKDAASKSIAA